VLHRSPRYLTAFRDHVETGDKPVKPGTLRDANSALHVEIQHHIAELMKRDVNTQLGGELLHLHATQKWLSALDKYLFELAELMGKAKDLGLPVKLTANIIRSVDVLLGSARLTVAENHNWTSAQVLIDITSKRETLVSWFRSKKLEDVVGANLAAKKTLLEIIVAYERLVWIFNQLAHTMLNDAHKPQPAPVATSPVVKKKKLDLESPANESWAQAQVVTP
jgi:hypothetical protein